MVATEVAQEAASVEAVTATAVAAAVTEEEDGACGAYADDGGDEDLHTAVRQPV